MSPLLLLWVGHTSPSIPTQEPWTPPATKLPAEFVQAVAFMQKHGMGDPRGGEFRRAKVVPGTRYGGAKPIEMFGWFFPSKGGKPGRLVTLQGISYPVTSPGKPANLDEALNPKFGSGFLLLYQNPLPTVATLLLRGEVERAESRYPKDQRGHEFAILASSFLSGLWDQAVTAHQRGDAETALRIALFLRAKRPVYEAEAQRTPGSENLGVLTYLHSLDALVADTRRRVRERRSPAKLETIAKLAQRPRITALIRALDEVLAWDHFRDGSVDFSIDPIVQALAREGDAAVEPLFETIEHDPRLTRSVTYGRHTELPEKIYPVSAAALAALKGILGLSFDRSDAKPMSLEEMKAFWQEAKSMPPAERWLSVIRDDSAGSARWLKAARHLFLAPDVVRQGAWVSGPIRKKGEIAPPRLADRFRAMANPSLTEIVAERAGRIQRLGLPRSNPGFYSTVDALELARYLAAWDPAGSRPTVKNAVEHAIDFTLRQEESPFDHVALEIGRTVAVAARSADDPLIDPYLAWLTQIPATRGWHSSRLFEPLVTLKADPKIQAAAERLFRGKDSRWNLVDMTKRRGSFDTMWLFVSPLIELEPVHRSFLALLQDETVIAEIVNDGGQLQTQIAGVTADSTGVDPRDHRRAPKPGERRAARTCDIAGRVMGYLGVMTPFQPYWPTRDKDRVLRRFRELVRQEGPRLRDRLGPHTRWN